MRWEAIGAETTREPTPVLFDGAAFARTFDTPGFRGMTFYEIYARSIINKVPPTSRMPFRDDHQSLSGLRSCLRLLLRAQHAHLSRPEPGLDFNSKIIVKVNAAELARKELARPRWSREHIAMGTNVDPYQRAEGRYQLMPGIIRGADRRREPVLNPDQGHAPAERDLDLLEQAAAGHDRRA